MITLSQTTATTGAARVGGQQLRQGGGEAGADRRAADPVPEAATAQVDGAEDGPPPVGAGGMTRWRQPLVIQVERTHAQQVAVGGVVGQHDRAGGQLGDGLAQRGQEPLASTLGGRRLARAS
jgi:hypothetical protein